MTKSTPHLSSVPGSGLIDDELQQSLYEKHRKIYPREVHGLYNGLRILCAGILLGLYYLLPWLSWDNHPAVLFDLPGRKFYILGLVLWPQDFIYLAFLLILAGLSLFFFTALAGRLWCGYACPQTVWTEVFLAIEHFLEGDRSQQIKLDKGPWTREKWRIKLTKHTAWILFALFTGFTFVAYFAPAPELASRIVHAQLGGWETFWLLFYSFATYGNAGWMREQVCKYMCPYARFQSAMFDADTFVIAYDKQRGEPRGSRKRGIAPRNIGLGDCVDCTLCVQVCPTGIDIRQGLQYECIGCASCIDVCNGVMDRLGYSRGLIRYATENSIHGQTTKILRPRIIVYGSLLLLFISMLGVSLLHRLPVQLDVLRDRNALYHEAADERIVNVYTLKLINMDQKPHPFRIEALGIPGLQAETEAQPVTVDAESTLALAVSLSAPESALRARSTPVQFVMTATDVPAWRVQEDARFLGPVPSQP